MSIQPFDPVFLLPVDGSAHAEGAARYLVRQAARLPGSRVLVLHAGTPGRLAPGPATQGAAALLEQAGIRFDVVQTTDDPAVAILQCAADEAVSEVVMGSRGLGRWSGLVIGSVAMKVVQHARMPVTVVGSYANPEGSPQAPAGSDRILLAIDGSRPAIRAAGYVCALRAAGLPLEVELTGVVGPIPPGFLQEGITPEKLGFYYRQEGDRMLYEARALLENAGVPTRRHIEVGYVADKLMQVATATACSRMVLGNRGHGGLSGLLVGSTAYHVMHLSGVPVTLVK
jgi:nucleotide-binding universal stress UspA family protein